MRNCGRITLLVAFTVLGNAASAHAQSRERFHRVTTTAQRDGRSPSTVSRLASTARDPAVSSSRSRADALHPYTARAKAEAESRDSDGARYSTAGQEPRRVARSTPAPSSPQSHNYYPTLRSGVAVQPPVRLTAGPVMIPRTSCCSSTSSQAIAGAGQSPGAVAGHHR